MRIRLFPAVLASALAIAGCGDGLTESEQFPLVQGTYDVSAPINEAPGARFTGTITVVDDSRTTSQFSGTYTLTLLAADGTKRGGYTGELVQGGISSKGSVQFDLGTNSFRWRGALGDVGNMTGSWILVDGTSNYTGSFVAVSR